MAQQNEKEMHQMVNDLFDAIDTIASKRIEHLEFDKTLKCQIINDSNKALGEYTVTDGVTDFVAYSENQQLRTGNWVFVTIPNNDFSQQKFITGKYTTDESEYYTYVNPMETYINMTGNLNTIDDTWKLVANHNVIKEVEIFRMGDTDPQNNAPIDSSSHLLAGFDRLGIQADFRSELGQYNLTSGHYGIVVRVKSFIPSTMKMNDPQATEDGYFKWTRLKLDSSDMFGNPYDFFIQTTQQVVYDISELGEIVGILVSFYQDNDFANQRKKRLPFVAGSDDPDAARDIYYNRSNLFVSNVKVSLGYDLSNFDEDTLLLTTFDSPIYSYVAGSSNEQNIKHLSLRWIHHDESGNLVPIDEIGDISLDEYNNPMIDIHWYKWKFANGVEDELAGTFWEEVPNIENPFQYNLNPSNDVEEERMKVIIQSPSESYITSLVGNFNYDPESEISKAQQEAEYERDLRSEIILYESNILDFTNEQEAPNLASVNLVRGLNLICDPEYGNGIYRIYDSYGQLLDKNQGYKQRRIIAHFNSVVLRDESTSPIYDVTWYIPAQQSMIVPPDAYKIETVEGEEQTSLIKPYSDPELSTDEKYYIIKQTQDNMVEQGSDEERLIRVEFEIPFKIRNFYSKMWNNNTIRCEIMRNGIPYVAETELVFSTASSNGTEYALAADFFDGDGNNLGAPIFYVDKENFSLKIVPHVFDNNGIEVTDKTRISYLPYSGALGFNLLKDEDGNGVVSINTTRPSGESFTPSGVDFYNYIITVRVSRAVNLKEYVEVDIGNGETAIQEKVSPKTVDLTEQIPIAVCFYSDRTKGLIGDNRIIYDSNGTNPQYYKSPYKLIDTPTDPPIVWSMHLNLDEYKGDAVRQYYPQIDAQSGELTVPPIFMSGNQKGISILASVQGDVIWCQPLYITQDVYASKFLNTWNGQLTVDEDGNRIMAALIGAGLKNADDNTFSGVLMGDVAGHGDTESPLGLYGYNRGEQSYGFKVDGTAFIGKQGSGRIIFDGTKSTIESSNFDKYHGMQIDLNDGKLIIPLGLNENNQNRGMIWFDSKATTYPFQVGENLQVDWNGNVFVKGSITATSGSFSGDLGTTINTLHDGRVNVGSHGGYGVLYSGDHSSFDSIADGFYLSGLGFSIGSKFKVDPDGTLHASGLSLSFIPGLQSALNGKASVSDVEEAATKATNYLYASSTVGLKIAPSSPQTATSNYIHITSQGVGTYYNNANYSWLGADGLKIYQNSNNIAEFTGNGARIGLDNGINNYTKIHNSGVTIYDKGDNPRIELVATEETGTNETFLTLRPVNERDLTTYRNGLYFRMRDEVAMIVNTKSRLDLKARGYMTLAAGVNPNAITIDDDNDSNFITKIQLTASTDTGGFLRPADNGGCSLGAAAYRWKNIFVQEQGNSSDLKEKDNIAEIKDYAKDFILNLKPVEYMWKTGDHRRKHLGFIAQDVASVCDDLNENLAIASAYYKDNENNELCYEKGIDDNLLIWTLSYNDFIAPMVQVIQEQHKEIEQLKQQVEALMNK